LGRTWTPTFPARSWSYHDALGRPSLALRETFEDGKYLATQAFYDTLGRSRRTTESFFATGPTVNPPGNFQPGTHADTITDFDVRRTCTPTFPE